MDSWRWPAASGKGGPVAGSLRRRAGHHTPDGHQLGKGLPSAEEDGQPSSVGAGETEEARRVGEYGGGSPPRSPAAGDGAAGGKPGGYSAGFVALGPHAPSRIIIFNIDRRSFGQYYMSTETFP